jgi:[acyl-carrier-protein] S-malonyltransferase
LINNAEAKAISDARDIQASLVRQLPSSVLWEDAVQTMSKMGVTTFVEVGPGTVLTGLIKRIVPEATWLNVNDPKSLEATQKSLEGIQVETR